MILAAFGNVLGNMPALESVLHAIDEEGIQTIVNTGDSVGEWPWPNEVIALLRERDIISIQGLRDRAVVQFLRKQNALRRKYSEQEFAAIQRTFQACSSENLEYLHRLPWARNVSVDGVDVTVCHGTVSSQTRSLDPASSEAVLLRQREECPGAIIVSGHAVGAFSRFLAGTLYLNPGNVGVDPGTAEFSIVSTEDDPWTVCHREVRYTTPAGTTS